MADPDRNPRPQTQPSGVEGEGLDPYPTYRDGPTTPHRATSTKATDVNLPRSRRTSALPILIALVVFALVILFIVGRLVWQGVETVEADAPVAVENPTTPAAISEAPDSDTIEGPPGAVEASEAQDSLDPDVGAEMETGPGEVAPEPGAIDVPGGDTTTPAN